jgi:CHAT domain-containing protein
LVLAYDVTDTTLLIYLLRGKRLVKAVARDIHRKKLDNDIRTLLQAMEASGDRMTFDDLGRFNCALSKKLYDLLLGDDLLKEMPQGAHLTIIPDDSLGVLPFEMLVLNQGGKVVTDKEIPYVTGAEFFGDRNPISYNQSVTALTLARTYGKAKGAVKKMLVMADPIFESRDARLRTISDTRVLSSRAPDDDVKCVLPFTRLDLTGKLATELNKLYEGQCTVYIGLDASKDAFEKRIAPGLEQYNRIVFATHGYFGKDLSCRGINEPVLVLTLVPVGTDGYLRMSEVMGLKMNADVAALTACQTALGKVLSGEGTMGMGRAFQSAGTRAVLMSLWSVEPTASVGLVQQFFGYRKEGKNNLEALQLARKKVRDDGYDHPFFWAAFVLSGEID